MTRSQRILIILGGALLVGLMVIAAFALGVYVGDRRRPPTAADLLGRPVGQANPPGAAGLPLDVLRVLPRPPDFVGEVQSVRGRSVVVRGPQGDRTVALDDFTVLYRPDSSKGSPQDLRPGLVIAVVGTPADGGRTVIADAIAVLPPQPKGPPPGP